MHQQTLELYEKAQELVLWVGEIVFNLASLTRSDGSLVETFKRLEFGFVVYDVNLREEVLHHPGLKRQDAPFPFGVFDQLHRLWSVDELQSIRCQPSDANFRVVKGFDQSGY